MISDEMAFRSIQGFSACSERDLRALLPYCRTARYSRFQRIHDEGAAAQKVFGVLKGEVVLHRLGPGSGKTYRLAVVRGGELFGFGEVMLPSYYTSAHAAGDCVLMEISREDFIHRFLSISCIREYVLLEMSRIARYLMCQVTGGEAMDDLAAYLLTRSKACGKTVGGKIRLQEKLLQPEIASLLNLSREHVTRLFARLKAQGAVDFNRGYAVIDSSWLDQAVRDKDLASTIQYRDALL